MFVLPTCKITGEEIVRTGKRNEDGGKKHWGVECSECGTKVGVIDEEEVYHFYNVLESA